MYKIYIYNIITTLLQMKFRGGGIPWNFIYCIYFFPIDQRFQSDLAGRWKPFWIKYCWQSVLVLKCGQWVHLRQQKQCDCTGSSRAWFAVTNGGGMVETGLFESCHSHNSHDLNSPCMVQQDLPWIACASSRQSLAPQALGEAVA